MMNSAATFDFQRQIPDAKKPPTRWLFLSLTRCYSTWFLFGARAGLANNHNAMIFNGFIFKYSFSAPFYAPTCIFMAFL